MLMLFCGVHLMHAVGRFQIRYQGQVLEVDL
jgi:hypothetical protein